MITALYIAAAAVTSFCIGIIFARRPINDEPRLGANVPMTDWKPPVTNPLYRGQCAQCGEPVNHVHPWWTSNPDSHTDAKPLHDECAKKYFKW